MEQLVADNLIYQTEAWMDKAAVLQQFENYLRYEEKAEATISKYLHDVSEMMAYMGDSEINKDLLIQYREDISAKCRAQTVNGKLSAVNAFLKFMDLEEYRIKFLKVQKRSYLDEKRELNESDYRRLLETARRQGKTQLYHLMLVLYGTGIRISELSYVTVEAINHGNAEICMKGKYRVIIFPKKLVKRLKEYIKALNIKSGYVFRTRTGRNLDRSNVCHALKRLCKDARVESSKVFPHNFRHLFAKSFYSIEKNLAHLADVLGHSSIETTRIYVAGSIKQYEKIMNRMKIGIEIQKPQNNHSVVSCLYIY